MAISREDGSIILKTKIDEMGLKTGLAKIKSFTKKATKTFAVIGVAATTATVAISKMAVSAYADYEQLVGGVETLFKGSAKKVMQYANDAFYTAGVSANEYMKQVTSFSASLISSTAGDTEKAADVANMALIDMSDNANKMGSSLESITTAYQGFAKGQYMLLDNLKLGYGGTKTEMERLLKDAEAYLATQGKTAKFSVDNLADVYTAINAIQQKLGIAGTTAKEAEKTISGAANMTKAAWQNVLVAISSGEDLDRAINNLVYSIQKYFENIVPVVERALQGIGLLIERVGPLLVQTVGRAVINALPSLLSAVYQMIIGLSRGIYQGIIDLFKGTAEKTMEAQISATKKAADNQKDLTKEVKKTNKELKGSVASFDEINTLSKQNAEDAENTGNSNTPTTADSGGTFDGSLFEQEISRTLTAIMGTVAVSLIAVGLILLFLGQIGWGIGFIIAGAVQFAVSMVTASKFGYDEIINILTTIMGIAGGALLALGIILLWFGGVVGKGIAIGMIIAGAALIVSAVVTKAAFSPNEIGGWLSLIMGIAGGALLALGIILCMVGSVPLGVGMIIAGSISLVSAIALNFDSVKNSITGWVAVIMGIAGAAMLVLGIILCITGVGLPIGIALIAAGAIALVTPIALNWNAFKEKVVSIFNAVINWVKNYGLLVLGIMLCLTGVGIPIGIALIVKWAKDSAEKGVPLATAIVGKVKEIWNAVKTFWNTHIAKVFTAKWWGELGSNAINGLIGSIEKGLNYIIKKINTLSWDIPDWVPVIGGQKWGFDFKEIKIPRLAQGTVIPPNKEFLAVLGDQKRGTNIEAPLETIKQAVAEVLAQINVGSGSPSKIEVPVIINGREILRAVRDAENEMGTQTVFGGFANAY